MPTVPIEQAPSLTFPSVAPSIASSVAYSPFDQLFSYWQNFQVGILDFIMRFIAAAIVVIVGFLIAWVVEWVIRWLVENLKINDFLRNAGMGAWLERANVELKAEKFLGSLAFWIVWIFFWMPALDLVNLSAFNQFLGQLMQYLPVAVVGGLIMVAGVFLAEFLRKVVETILKGSKVHGGGTAGVIIYWAVVVFALAASLSHLGVARDFINIMLSGFIALFALAGGLAFGLGGQDLARDMLAKIKREVSN